MKNVTIYGMALAMLLFLGVQQSQAQSNKAVDMFKNHINKVVHKVEDATQPKKKRAILNDSFDNMLTSFKRVRNMRVLSKNDQVALNELEQNITEKKNELNGKKGFKRVPDSQLNNFANYTQQNIEQAGSTITISVVVLLLIIIIIILLA